MKNAARIVIADRSVLAGNLYRILLAPLEAMLLVRRNLDEAVALLSRREVTNLAIFNTNVFCGAFDAIATQFATDEHLAAIAKIFLTSTRHADDAHRACLASLPNTAILPRPFHPDAFTALVRRLLQGGRHA